MKKLLLSVMTAVLLSFTGTVAVTQASTSELAPEQVEQQHVEKKLTLSEDDKVFGGVVGGIAEFFDIDPTILRIAWGILAVCYGIGILAYFVAWLVMPEPE